MQTVPPPSAGTHRLLLVGGGPLWRDVVRQAADRIGATVEVQPDAQGALEAMMPQALPSHRGGRHRPGSGYAYVLAAARPQSRAADALAGMMDEVMPSPRGRLILLGSAGLRQGAAIPHVATAEVAAVEAALRHWPEHPPSDLPPIGAADLDSALHGGGLRMRFQPIVSATDLAPIGLEALARLHHHQRGILHPKDFIPVTIACGREQMLAGVAAARTYRDIGCRLGLATFCRQGGTELFVSLNLPISTIVEDQAVQRGLALCAAARVSPARILLEVLETPTLPDVPRLHLALDRWRAAGFRIAIDDAGPALPHWQALMDLPFDVLKLDGAMVADPAHQPLMARIVQTAKAHGRFVIAEGVENAACLTRALAVGVDGLQGFMFSRPLPALAVPIWLRQWGKVRPG